MKRTILIIVSVFCAMFSVNGGLGFAQEAPYKSYSYTEWGKPAPAPHSYLPETLVTGGTIGAGDFKEPQSMFVDRVRQELYIADTGNNRIVVLDSAMQLKKVLASFQINGSEQPLSKPTDVFVSAEGKVYIADNGNGRIIVCDRNGDVLSVIGKPDSDIIPKDFIFQPEKLVADKQGRIYVQAFGVFQGLISLEENGDFLNYFGGNRVDITAKVLLDMMWKRILTKAQKRAMQSFVPIEYSNLYIDDDDFIYTTVRTSQNSLNELKKLNPLGINVLRANSSTSYLYPNNDFGDHPVVWQNDSKVDTMFVDINVDSSGFISALDSTRGKIFQYDQESNLLFAFGGRGEQKGTFKNPAAIEMMNDKLLVLDSAKNNITVFGLTEFGKDVRLAVKLYNEGYYKENLELWNNILQRNTNYLLAYIGLGKAYYQLGDYKNAMKHFKLGYDKQDYSDAFKKYYTEKMRANFTLICLVLLALYIAYRMFRARKKIGAFYESHKQKKGGVAG